MSASRMHWGFEGVTKPGLPRQHPDAVRGRRQHPDAGVQGVPGQRREGLGGRHGTAIAGHHAAAPPRPRVPPSARAHPGGGEAHRRLPLHRLQGLPGRLHGVERPARPGRAQRRASTPTRRTSPTRPGPDAVQRSRDRRPPRVAHPQGRLHALRRPGLPARPARRPGAIVQYANGIVDFQEENCIGCGYCITGCPFNIPRLRKEDSQVYKCTLCSDRVAVGLEPACIKTCPTQALTFGSQGGHDGARRITGSRTCTSAASPRRPCTTRRAWAARTCSSCCRTATGRRPTGSRGTRASARSSTFWRSGVARALGVVTMFAVLVAGILHYMRHGPLEVPDEAKGSREGGQP